jgi:OmpA-OmpF porin, OOP family
MKNKLFAILFMLTVFSLTAHAQFLKKLGDKIKDKTNQRADQKTDQAIDKGLDKTEDAAKKKDTTVNSSKKDDQTSNQDVSTNTDPQTIPTLKVYQNYDFVPGDKILFEDHFIDDQDGEFPAHWELVSGQAVLNKANGGEEAFFLTEGNYARVKPRMKTEMYLTDPFTIEFDSYFLPGAYGPIVMLAGADKEQGWEKEGGVHVNNSEIGFENSDVKFYKSYPEEISGEKFDNKWHHIAIAYKNKQLKIYVDQYRLVLVPDTKQVFEKMSFAGIGNDKTPIIIKNVRVAAGGQMNMIGKKFTESKIVTHGINFDYNKATIKPESMGTLNMVVQVLKDNPEIKFEVGGHTDADGSDDYNLKLSQQRADAVKEELIKLGIDASRLTAKGYGETKPISDNTLPEGKANNRRVEFVKQ